MKRKDRREACKVLQEIETDLIFWVIESYKSQDIQGMVNALSLAQPFLEVHKEICSHDMK